MIHKLPDITENINPDAPFEKCALGRQSYAELLTDIVANTEQGVISLNGGWGTGKTTFVRMWEVFLKNKGFSTLYFNVWDNDYTIDPMVSLMAQLLKLFKRGAHKKNVKSVISTFGKIVLNVGKPLGKGIIKKFSGVDLDEVFDGLEDASDVAVDELVNLGERVLDRFSEEQKDVSAFKNALEYLVKTSVYEETSGDEALSKPIICFIDELDRCNPRYSVLVLERIKHIFSVPGIIFVLSVDKKQFGNAIRGYYGSDLIDANEYLRRFIDLDLNLPVISSDRFFDYLYRSFDIESLFSKRHDNDIRGEHESFKVVGKLLLDRSNITLRQAEKMMSHIQIVLSSIPSNQHFTASVIAILAYLRSVNSTLYENLSKRLYSVQEMITELENEFKNFFFAKKYDETPVRYFTFSIAEIICMYNTQEYDRKVEKLLDVQDKDKKLLVSVRIIPEDILIEALSWENQRFRFGTPSLNSVINKIELVHNML